MSANLHGLIIAAYGRHYLAETPEGEIIECVPRGKKSEIACGDTIEFQRTGTDQGVVERIMPRRSLLYRSDLYRQKLIAANAEQEEAVEEIEVDYTGDVIDVGFNVGYLLDVLNNIHTEEIQWSFNDANSSALITVPGNDRFKYVVMPMRILISRCQVSGVKYQVQDAGLWPFLNVDSEQNRGIYGGFGLQAEIGACRARP